MTAQRTTTDPSEADARQLGRTLLDLAREVDRAENIIKRAVIDWAKAGNTSEIIDTVTLWLSTPPTDIVAQKRLDP